MESRRRFSSEQRAAKKSKSFHILVIFLWKFIYLSSPSIQLIEEKIFAQGSIYRRSFNLDFSFKNETSPIFFFYKGRYTAAPDRKKKPWVWRISYKWFPFGGGRGSHRKSIFLFYLSFSSGQYPISTSGRVILFFYPPRKGKCVYT
jgi:hypothetical protein